MKKLLAIAMVAFIAVGCAEATSTKEEKTTNQTNGNSTSDGLNQREKEIRDSTKMLDEKLKDTTN